MVSDLLQKLMVIQLIKTLPLMGLIIMSGVKNLEGSVNSKYYTSISLDGKVDRKLFNNDVPATVVT